MGCLKTAYHIRRAMKLLEENTGYSIEKASLIAAEMIGASEWDAEMVEMFLIYCPDEAKIWAKKIMSETKKQIDSIEW